VSCYKIPEFASDMKMTVRIAGSSVSLSGPNVCWHA
jgi:hypothetical protein